MAQSLKVALKRGIKFFNAKISVSSIQMLKSRPFGTKLSVPINQPKIRASLTKGVGPYSLRFKNGKKICKPRGEEDCCQPPSCCPPASISCPIPKKCCEPIDPCCPPPPICGDPCQPYWPPPQRPPQPLHCPIKVIGGSGKCPKACESNESKCGNERRCDQ